LEDEEEEVEGAVDFADDDNGPDDDFVGLGYSDAEEHDTDGEFQGHVGEEGENNTNVKVRIQSPQGEPRSTDNAGSIDSTVEHNDWDVGS
jgi:hypothetical protein